LLFAGLFALTVAACAGKPLEPWSAETPPLVLLPASQAGVMDERGRFREVVCAVLEDHGSSLPNYRDCDAALTRIGAEPAGTAAPVNLGEARIPLIAAMVPGIGWECFENWLQYENEFRHHVATHGYQAEIFSVSGLSGTTSNARQIRDTILAHADKLQPRQLVLVGYSKGAPDLLEAVVSYPEIRPFVAAIVSVSGAVGGSPLANAATEDQLDLLRYIPESECSGGDGRAVESLRPSVRRAWLAENQLPKDIPFYSVVTLPHPDQVSSILRPSWKKLGRIDPRNDSQVIFYDQIIPGSTLLGYLNADHWAIAVPIAENHPFIGRHFVDRNGYPRQALLEAVLRIIEEDMLAAGR
jgi:hypothetical protein